ncbi:hypothetical protein BJX99DRAFT_232269 [Aspergillus californicus]
MKDSASVVTGVEEHTPSDWLIFWWIFYSGHLFNRFFYYYGLDKYGLHSYQYRIKVAEAQSNLL